MLDFVSFSFSYKNSKQVGNIMRWVSAESTRRVGGLLSLLDDDLGAVTRLGGEMAC